MDKHTESGVFLLSRSDFSGTLVNSIGFEWMLVGIACLGFLYAPLLTFLRAPPTKEEKKVSDVITNGNPAIANDDANAKKGIYNIALTLDNGDLALPQSTVNGNRPSTIEQCVTKL